MLSRSYCIGEHRVGRSGGKSKNMTRFINRRRFAIGAGLLLGGASTPLGRTALAQEFERRDPPPESTPFGLEPVNPTVVQRWDSKNGLLQPPEGVLDPSNPYSGSPSFLFQYDQPSEKLVARWEGENGLALNVHHVYIVCKAERVIGTIGYAQKTAFADGSSSTSNRLLTADLSRFDWSTYVFQVGPFNVNQPNLVALDMILRIRGTGRIWVGAVQLVNLGLPERHPQLRDLRFRPSVDAPL